MFWKQTHDPITMKGKFTKAVSTDFRNPEHCLVLWQINKAMHGKAQGDLKMWVKYIQVQRRKQKGSEESRA